MALTAKAAAAPAVATMSAADRRADAAGEVEADAVQRHRRRQVGARHHVADRGLPGRVVERDAAADEEGEAEQRPWRQHPHPGGDGQRDRDREHEALGDQHHPAAVEAVGDRAGGEREDHDRQRGRGLHQRHHVGRGGDRRHHPGGADRLHQPAEVRDEAREPDRPEDRAPERRQRGGAGRARRCACCGRFLRVRSCRSRRTGQPPSPAASVRHPCDQTRFCSS